MKIRAALYDCPFEIGLCSAKERGHGRLGRVDTGLLAPTLPVGTKDHANAHRRDACSPFQKYKSKRLLVLLSLCIGVSSLFFVQTALAEQTANSQTATAPNPSIVAHRGSSAQAPENTLPAFQLAWKQAADAIETDLQLTKDGHIVCFHDKDTKRVNGQPLAIADATLEELRQLDMGGIQPQASERALRAWSSDQYKGTRIPTTAEVFAIVPAGKKIFIEIKCGPEIIDPLLRELGSSGLTPDQVVVIGFNSALLKSLKERDPKWQTAWLCSFDKKPNGKPRNAPAKVLKTLKDMRAHALMSGRGDVDKGLLDQIRAAGMEHYVWTINDPKLGPTYKAQGVDAIITDLPAEMRAALNSSTNP